MNRRNWMNLVTTMLINVINNSHNSVVDRDIAKYLIANHENINSLLISELAKNTNVSISQVSRFVRSLGLNLFLILKKPWYITGSKSDIQVYKEK